MIATDKFEKVFVESREELRNWLLENHSKNESFWLVNFKKSMPVKYVDRWEVLDELICFGWIDGIRRKLDEERTMQLITQRKVQHWAKSYKDRAVVLSQKGLMHERGLRSVEEGKSNGLGHFMDDVDSLVVPED